MLSKFGQLNLHKNWYGMSKKSCPLSNRHTLYKNGQRDMDMHAVYRTNLTKKIFMVTL